MSQASDSAAERRSAASKSAADARSEDRAVRNIRLGFAIAALISVALWMVVMVELVAVTTLVLFTWAAWELIKGSARRRAIRSSTGHVLRVAHVWKGEVMADALMRDGQSVTLSASGSATFNIPELGLPPTFNILKPGSKGYVLTLAQGMGGTVSIDDARIDVADFLGSGLGTGQTSQFQGKTVGPGDWGVVHLDGAGDHVLFFQFVPNAVLPSTRLRDPELLLPALGFAVILHAVFLWVAYTQFNPGYNTAVFPGDPELVADYMVQKPQEPLEQEEPIAGIDDGDEKAPPTSTAGVAGKAGGEGETERARAENPEKGEPDEAIPKSVQKGLLSHQSRQQISKVLNRGGFDKDLGSALARLQGPTNNGGPGGFGHGTGIGFGDGKDGTGTVLKGGKGGPGGGGNALGDVVTQRAIKTGGKRPPHGIDNGKGLKETTVKVSTGTPHGSLGGLTAAQINKVVFSRKNAIQTCYSRQLQRSPGLGGKVVIHWEINSSGKVTRAKVSKTTMHNGRVEDCIVREVLRMKFPSPKGGSRAVVNYPFLFDQQ